MNALIPFSNLEKHKDDRPGYVAAVKATARLDIARGYYILTRAELAGILAEHWPDQAKRMPSLAAQASNLAQAALQTTVRAATGQRVLASPDEQSRRLQICGACDRFDVKRQRCAICGCRFREKLALEGQRCPHPDGFKW